MAVSAVTVLRKRYLDSVVLMTAAKRLTEEAGVEDAAAVMGTSANKEALRRAGFDAPELDGAEADDLVVAIRARSSADLPAPAVIERAMSPEIRTDRSRAPRSIDEAIALHPDVNVAEISVPGTYAAAEARRALDRGSHVFCFSSGVTVDDEIALKRHAGEAGLLMMGPDCGTSIIAGIGLGFANAVARGHVGIVGASGTGIQALSVMIDRGGAGISHALGTGGRDLMGAVGGRTFAVAYRALIADPVTHAIVLVGKNPDPEVLAHIRDIDARGKTVVECFFGAGGDGDARTLDEAAARALGAVGKSLARAEPVDLAEVSNSVAPGRRHVRGLFAGGTYCVEAQRVALDAGLVVRSNAPFDTAQALDDERVSSGHAFIDMGAESFTLGRPHPMIDARARSARLREEAADPSVEVVIVDIVLGYGAAADPAGDIAPAIADAIRMARDEGRPLAVVASVCGTERDPQVRSLQEKTLRETGAIVFETNRLAVEAALALVGVRT